MVCNITPEQARACLDPWPLDRRDQTADVTTYILCLISPNTILCYIQTSRASSQARWWSSDDLSLFCSHTVPCSHWVHEHFLPKYSRALQLKLSSSWVITYASDPSNTSNCTKWWLKKKRIKVDRSKSKPQPDWNAPLIELCISTCP